jgi:hypothetical protein
MSFTNFTATYCLTTDCTCEYYADNVELMPSPECFGCYEDELALLQENIDLWLERNDVEFITVEASGLGWRNASGQTVITGTAKNVVDMLRLNGDYRAEFYFSANDKLTARRWSHDEPTGTGLFIFTPATITE